MMRAVAWRCREEWWRTVEIYIWDFRVCSAWRPREEESREYIYMQGELGNCGGGVD